MDRSEKVAYYCSELGARSNQDALLPTNSNNNNNNNSNNNNNMIGKFDGNQVEIHDEAPQMQNQQQQDSQSANSSGDYPSRIMNRYNHEQTHGTSEQLGRQFVHSQVLGQAHMQQQSQQPQSLGSSSVNPQQQYLISNNNPQHLTNLTPQHFAQQHNNSPFPNQVHSTNYHINSNHHLYQAGAQPQQQTQARNSLFQHHKSPSMGSDSHPKLQNQMMPQQLSVDLDIQRRQLQAQHQQGGHNEQGNLTSSQSMTQGDFNRLRRKPEHMGFGLTSEVGLDSLNLDFEAMLMSDGQNMNHNNHQLLHRQQQNSGQNIDKLLRSFANQPNPNDNNCDKPNGSDMSSAGYGGAGQADSRPNKDSLFMVPNRSEDNIYEEIDIMTMSRFQNEYPVDSISMHSDTWKKKNAKKFLVAGFTRWFSTRKKSSNSQNSDQEENQYDLRSIRRPRIISLPDPIPDNLTPEKLKRRLIVGSIVDSENSYTNSLFRLVYEYKKPLEEADPPILSANKIRTIFFCLEPILQCHTMFGLTLQSYVQEWDEKEIIGPAFYTYFSRQMVLGNYSSFINNFTEAMETARRASKSRAFAQFLHDKSVASPDRLSFFGSMVKPVQRFPQFILLLSDLLKHTPANHPDRIHLQQALTELESLADRLNESKRDAERHFAVKQLLKDHLNESNAHSQRYLLRQDDTCLLDMDSSTNTVLKSKSRKMYLLNDMLICVSISSNRLKFAVPLTDITVVESITPAISNLLAHSNFRSLNGNPNAPPSPQNYTIERMECEHQSLVHDLKLMSDISLLVSSLRFQYNGLNPAVPEQICMGIREEIRKKEFQMTLIDRSCLQLKLHSKNNKDALVVQFSTPEAKRDWLIDVRLTKLRLDRANNPGWEYVTVKPEPPESAHHEQNAPLFVKSLAIFKSDQSTLTCALHYYLRQAPFVGENPAGVLWICNVGIGASSLGALATNGAEVSLIHSYELSDSHVTCLESVGSTLWIGLRQGRIIVIDANSPGEWVQFASLDVQSEVTCIKYFGHFVYVGLMSGIVAVFDAINFDKPYLIQLSQSPVTCLLPINEEVFVCSHNKIWRIKETNIIDSLQIIHHVRQNEDIIPLEEEAKPNLLAHCGNGIWVSLIDSPIVKLYHAETLQHLLDINVGLSISRVLRDLKHELKITVTSMMATRGLLWIGTNVGMIATLNLPRLQGVPLASGNINIALHRFLGPVSIMLNLSAGAECVPQLPFNNNQQQQLRSNHQVKNEDAEAIYGQYADLMNVGDYITSGTKSGPLSMNPADRMGWDFPNMSNRNISDDSGSNASSGAIYQDGRVAKQTQGKSVVDSANNMGLQGQQQVVQNQLMAAGLGQTQTMPPASQTNNLNNIYDKTQTAQSVTYNQGSLNGAQPGTASTTAGQNSSDGVSIDRLQQHPTLSTSQTHLAKVEHPNNQPVDYGSQSGKMHNKLYDQPAQLIQQQQQIIQQSAQVGGSQVDGNMLNSLQQPVTSGASTYGTLGGKTKMFMGNKTVLVLGGGNGYQRMAPGDNKPFGEHAHCIIWEYKV